MADFHIDYSIKNYFTNKLDNLRKIYNFGIFFDK